MAAAVDCDFSETPIGCLLSAMSNQLERSLAGSAGGKNQISVGPNGDIPMLPFGAVVLSVLLGIGLRVVFGRPRFLPKALSSLAVRLATFATCIAVTLSVVKQGEAAMKDKDPLQGPNFLPVSRLTTTGPYEHTRNPMYCCFTLIVPAAAVLADSLWMGAAMSLVPLYLDRYVIPAEEALLRRLFGSVFDAYAARVPRWLPGLDASLLLVALVFLIALWVSTRLGQSQAKRLVGLKHMYFPVAARGDAARLALVLSDIPYEDKRVAPADWMPIKPTTPWSQLPYVELADGTVLGQSFAILRYIGKGTGLYPTDALEAAYVDELMDGLNDVASKTNNTGQGLELATKVAKRTAACLAGGDIYVACERVEACYRRVGAPGPYLTGKLTIADLHLFAQVGWATSGFFDGVDPAFLVAFPRIQAVRKAIVSIPAVASWYASEMAKPYMELVVGGHPARKCYATMIASSRSA